MATPPAVSYHIANLLEKMSSADKDFRFMATNDLMSELQKDSITLDEDSERKVVKMLLKLLEDKNGEVQNLAVKCLGPLVNKVKEHQVELIVDTLCGNMCSENEALRDVSSMGLKTVIAEMPASTSPLAANICKRITPKLVNAIARQDAYVPVQLEALEILSDLLIRFGPILVPFHASIEEALMAQLASSRLAVRKRSITALSHLVATCQAPLFAKVMEALLAALKTKKGADSRTYVNAVGSVARTAGHRFGDYLPKVIPIVLQFTEKANDDDELREYCLQAFETFLIRCPKEMNQFFDQVVQLCARYLQYDPNYHYGDEDEEMDELQGVGAVNGTGGGGYRMDADQDAEDEEEAEYSDDDDMSWKVRRAAAKCLEAAILTRRQMLPNFYKDVAPLLINRFKEREENVKADIFHVFNALLRQTKLAVPKALMTGSGSISTTDSPELLILRQLSSQIPALVKAVNRQLREKSLKTRQCCFAVLTELLSVLPEALNDHMALLIPGIQYSLGDKSANSTMRIETLAFVYAALTTHKPAVFHPFVGVLVPLAVQTCNDGFYKVVAEGLTVVQELVKVLRPLEMPSSFDFTPYVRVIYDAVYEKLKATDIDQEVKEKAIIAMGQLIATFGDYLSVELRTCLPLLLDRLKNEITRLTAVRALTTIALSPLKIDLRPILPETSPQLASFLRKNQRALKLASLQLLQALSQNYAPALAPDQTGAVLEELPPLINDNDLQIAQMAIQLLTMILTGPQRDMLSGAVMAKLLTTIMELLRSPLLQGASLAQVVGFFKTLQTCGLAKPTFKELISTLTSPVYQQEKQGALHRAAARNIAKMVAAVCSVKPSDAQSVVDQLINDVKNGKQPESVHYFALIGIGEVGRQCPQALEGRKIEEIILAAFNSSKEDVQKAASQSLGDVAAGNLEKFLPFVLKEIQTQPKRQYLLLISLKEIISVQSLESTAASFIRPHISDIWTALMGHAGCQEEGTRNVVAECLGKLCLLEPRQLLPKLMEGMESSDPLIRATIVTAVKFTIVDQPQAIDESLKKSIGEFLKALRDPDLNVRRVALVTFNSAVHNKPALVRDLLEQLLPNLYNETKIRKELIREVEMGPFKHTVDDGLDLRKAAFECMYTLLETCLERLDVFEFLTHIEDGLKDDYDIKMLTYLMLTRLASLCPTQVLQRLEKLVEPLKATCLAKIKANSVKQEYERQDELKRAAIRAFVALQKVPDSEKNPQVADFQGLIKSTPELNQILESVRKDPGSSAGGSMGMGGPSGEDTMDTS